MDKDIANQIISSMGKQIDLFFTLSVAICGGIIALVFQLALHNTNNQNSKLIICGKWMLYGSFFLEGLSILSGYLSSASITANIPSIYKIDFSKLKTWGAAEFEGFPTIEVLVQVQFWTFIGGIGLLFILILCNWCRID